VFVPLDDVRDLWQEAWPAGEEEGQRADLLYVVPAEGKAGGLLLRFVEVKFRAERRSANESALLEKIASQTRGNAARWHDHFFREGLPAAVRAVRRSRLVRVLLFYTEKARRHALGEEAYGRLLVEYDRLLEEKGSERVNL
jgi:hypothetical protein